MGTTHPLPCSWESTQQRPASPILSEPGALTGAACEGTPQTSLFRVQKPRPTTILTTSEQLSKSDPTPPHSVTDIMSDSEDKKRNKLGYQRISIACGMFLPCRPDVATRPLCRVNTRRVACMCNTNRGPAHCRRRKIRCLLAEGDSQDRCQNCIRLKKECVFYPVDQQQMLDTRSQSGAKSGPESIPSSAVSPSPPELASGRPFERSRQYGSFPSLPSLPSNAPPGPGFGIPLGHGSTFPNQGELIPGHPSHPLANHESVGMPPVEYGYQHTSSDGQRQWEQVGDLSSPSASMNRARDSMQSQYYRSSPTVPPTADFAPFPSNASSGAAPQMQHSEGPFQYPINQAQAQAWNQSQMGRSMSYTHLQEVGGQGYMPSAVGYPPHSSHEGQPTGTSGYGSNAIQAPTLAPHPATMGNPMMPYAQQHPYMFQAPGGPGSVSASPISSQHPYGNQWYGEPSPYGSSEQSMRSSADHRSFSGKPGQ